MLHPPTDGKRVEKWRRYEVAPADRQPQNLNQNIMTEVLQKLQELQNLTLLAAKTALNMNDVALLTGLSKSHIYKLVCSRKIPHYKSEGGKLTYFNKQEVENWLLAHRVSTTEEAEQAAINYCVTKKKGGAR